MKRVVASSVSPIAARLARTASRHIWTHRAWRSAVSPDWGTSFISFVDLLCQTTASYDILAGGLRPANRARRGCVALSRVGVSLKSARERAGWSREALAYRSGLSWAAIAQIESGRRREVRLSSLSALANALGVSVDYLVGSEATVSPKLLGHSAFIYSSDDEYVASMAAFLAEGIARAECVLAVSGRRQIGLIRDALGDDAVHVEFRDSSEWYRSPSGALSDYHTFVKEQFERGAHWVR